MEVLEERLLVEEQELAGSEEPEQGVALYTSSRGGKNGGKRNYSQQQQSGQVQRDVSKQTKVKCRVCKEIGHIARQCPKRNNNNNPRENYYNQNNNFKTYNQL